MCKWLIKTGKRKGTNCPVKPKSGEYCGKHKKKGAEIEQKNKKVLDDLTDFNNNLIKTMKDKFKLDLKPDENDPTSFSDTCVGALKQKAQEKLGDKFNEDEFLNMELDTLVF